MKTLWAGRVVLFLTLIAPLVLTGYSGIVASFLFGPLGVHLNQWQGLPLDMLVAAGVVYGFEAYVRRVAS